LRHPAHPRFNPPGSDLPFNSDLLFAGSTDGTAEGLQALAALDSGRAAEHFARMVAGLGGRSITLASLKRTLLEAIADKLQPLTFMDLDWRIVNRQLERESQVRRSGPIAENLLRDVGTVASKVS
jgi:hypothetical protein